MVADLGEGPEARPEDLGVYANQAQVWLKEGLGPVFVPFSSTEPGTDSLERRGEVPRKASFAKLPRNVCVHGKGKRNFPS